jgi:hypothetical protein
VKVVPLVLTLFHLTAPQLPFCNSLDPGQAVSVKPNFRTLRIAAPKAAEFLGFSGTKQSVVLKEALESRISL